MKRKLTIILLIALMLIGSVPVMADESAKNTATFDVAEEIFGYSGLASIGVSKAVASEIPFAMASDKQPISVQKREIDGVRYELQVYEDGSYVTTSIDETSTRGYTNGTLRVVWNVDLSSAKIGLEVRYQVNEMTGVYNITRASKYNDVDGSRVEGAYRYVFVHGGVGTNYQHAAHRTYYINTYRVSDGSLYNEQPASNLNATLEWDESEETVIYLDKRSDDPELDMDF